MSTNSDRDERNSSTSPIREDVVRRLLHGLEQPNGPASMTEFIGLEFTHPPTSAERDEAHRRYVQELVSRAMRPSQGLTDHS